MSVSLKESYDIAYDGSENAARMDLFIDTSADLAGLTHFDSIKLLQGSTAEDISTGDKYMMQTGGTWVLQPIANAFQNVYTKAETDALINPLQAASATHQTALTELINTGSKNKLKLTDTATTTKKGVTLTYNNDGTYTLDSGGNPSTGADYFYIARSSENPVFPSGSVISGCTGGTDSTYRLQIAGTTIYQYDSAVTLSADTSGSLIFYFAAGVTFDNLVISPMVCSSADYALSPSFEPYCPTLAELYALVKSYHP